MNATETRSITSAVQYRAADKGPGALGGYALKFERYSQNLGGFVEQVARGAVDKTIADAVDVLCRYQHDDNHLLGRTASGTLVLTRDDTGLLYDVPALPDTTSGRDVAELCRRGDVTGSSFAFRTLEDDWGFTDQGFPCGPSSRSASSTSRPSSAPPTSTPAAPSARWRRRSTPPRRRSRARRAREIAARLRKPTVIDLNAGDGGQRATHPPTSVLLQLVELERKRTTL